MNETVWMRRKRKKATEHSFFFDKVEEVFRPMLVMKTIDREKLEFPAAAEVKYDGIRAIVRVKDGRSSIQSRNGEDYTNRYRSLCYHLSKLPDGLYDGEIYCPENRGSSTALSSQTQSNVKYRLFDVPELPYPYLLRRMKVVEAVRGAKSSRIVAADVIGIAQNYNDAKKYASKVISGGGEGVVLKPLRSPYCEGERCHWLKIKEEE
jgi:bifunctional non-homologous end joining protein LigD